MVAGHRFNFAPTLLVRVRCAKTDNASTAYLHDIRSIRLAFDDEKFLRRARKCPAKGAVDCSTSVPFDYCLTPLRYSKRSQVGNHGLGPHTAAYCVQVEACVEKIRTRQE